MINVERPLTLMNVCRGPTVRKGGRGCCRQSVGTGDEVADSWQKLLILSGMYIDVPAISAIQLDLDYRAALLFQKKYSKDFNANIFCENLKYDCLTSPLMMTYRRLHQSSNFKPLRGEMEVSPVDTTMCWNIPKYVVCHLSYIRVCFLFYLPFPVAVFILVKMINWGGL